jgi:hypothetical protein
MSGNMCGEGHVPPLFSAAGVGLV